MNFSSLSLILLVLILNPLNGLSQPQVADHGRITSLPDVHDPVMAKEGNTYYIYHTGHNVSVMSSVDMIKWKIEGQAFSQTPSWALHTVPGYKGHTWAPDILYHNGNYHLFYSCSSFGKNTSAIGHAIRSTLHADTLNPWQDTGVVLRSQAGVTDYNAIDPNVIIDKDNHPWMTFGSFWGGIQLVRLTDDMTTTIKPEIYYTISRRHALKSSQGGKFLGDNAVEAPFIFRHGKYYYLFVSFDYCCRGKQSNYKVVVGRSRDIKGPYLDKDGKSMLDGGGSLVIYNNKDFVASGHCAVYRWQGIDYFLAHGYQSTDGAAKLILRQLKWDKKGWPVVVL